MQETKIGEAMQPPVVLMHVAPNRIRRPRFRFLDLMHVVIPKPRTLSGDMH